MWCTTDIADFSRASLDALAAFELPAVRIADFASPTEVQALQAALVEHSTRTNSIAAVTRLGISQYEQGIRGSKTEYFRRARELAPVFDRIFAASFDPLGRFLGRLRELGIDADVMTEPGHGRYWAGNGKLREGTTPVHVDFAPQDSAGWAVNDTRVQLAWNLYLDDPGGHGDLRLWEKRWSADDDVEYLLEGEYFYDPAVVDGVRRLDVPTTVGDVVLINSAGYHAVAESHGRLAYGSFASIFDDGTWRLWS